MSTSAAASRWFLRTVALLGVTALGELVTGCGTGEKTSLPSAASAIPRALVLEARPIGRGTRFEPPAAGRVPGRCLTRLGDRVGVHVEVFASDRVVIVPAGIGTRPPLSRAEGRIVAAGCYGDLVTLEPTGVVLVRPDLRPRLADLFQAWGQPLSRHRVAGFAARPGRTVVVFVNGRRWPGRAGTAPLTRHSEIVVEIGPRVPPHRSYTFPPGT